MAKVKPLRSDYRYFHEIATRWHDNDAYGHVNNVVYYSYFDTVANHFLIHEASLSIQESPIIGLVVHSECNYLKSLAYPDTVHAGLRIGKLGGSSVTYEIAVFKNDEDDACAHGTFTHVFVNRETNKPTKIPAEMRTAFEGILKVEATV